ncbi:Protein MtfA [Planctomycetes bacterium CA13]|uniref:Protein MtfA n=1 Tax=Novipirellula herctigrandis TaxID=2527986 RepID=A0A5C5YUL7_9BACT|nr:Protein MtfA [Planctomycetes bacterium CA13]
MHSWYRNRQRRKLLASPFPRPWQELLHDRVWQYQQLEIEQRDKLHNCVKTIVAEVDWIGLDGHFVNEAMKVTIAGHASLMLLGFENDFMDEVRTIQVCRQEFDDNRESDPIYATETKSGRAQPDGTTILSWHHVLNANYYGDRNIVIHEFAHHVDRRDGQMHATLNFQDATDQQRWDRVVAEEYADLCDAAASGRWTLLRHYGAKNRTEFFAVATECFFESPDRLRRSHAELYDLLRSFYNLDTVEWLA